MNNVRIEDIDLDDPRFRIKPYQQMVSSLTGALITSVFVTPLDVVKIRMQAQQKAMLSNKCFVYCNGLMDHLCPCTNNGAVAWLKANGKFNNTLDAFIKISKKEGVSALYNGLSPTLTLALPATVVYFVTYEQLRLLFKDAYNKRHKEATSVKQPLWIPALAGAGARIWTVIFVNPLELIRTKMHSQKLSYSEMTEAMREVIRRRGLQGLWIGLGTTLLRDVPFSALYWMNYEYVKKTFFNSQTTFHANLVGGAVSGALAATLTLPFDVVKTHKQIEIGEKQIYTGYKNPASTKSTWEILQKIYRQSGVRGLFAGITPRIIKVSPACAIMIATFEQSKQFFGLYNANQLLNLEEKLTRIDNKNNL